MVITVNYSFHLAVVVRATKLFCSSEEVWIVNLLQCNLSLNLQQGKRSLHYTQGKSIIILGCIGICIIWWMLCMWKQQVFEVTERTSRGFAGKWGRFGGPTPLTSTTRFEAPCCLRNDFKIVGKDGKVDYASAVFLCRPTGQGKSMVLVRFGGTRFGNLAKSVPGWIVHSRFNRVFEEDMGFLASQNETLVRKKVATKDLYLNLKSSDTWVSEYRKWLDLTGHGMPYYFGHRSQSQSANMAVAEAAPAGLVAATASSYPARGSFGAMFARDPTNRYFRHVVHCKSCLRALNGFKKFQKVNRVGLWQLWAGSLCTYE